MVLLQLLLHNESPVELLMIILLLLLFLLITNIVLRINGCVLFFFLFGLLLGLLHFFLIIAGAASTIGVHPALEVLQLVSTGLHAPKWQSQVVSVGVVHALLQNEAKVQQQRCFLIIQLLLVFGVVEQKHGLDYFVDIAIVDGAAKLYDFGHDQYFLTFALFGLCADVNLG